MELNFENSKEYSEIYSKLYNSKIIKPEIESKNLLIPSKKLSEKILDFQNEYKKEVILYLDCKDYDFYLSSNNYLILTNEIFNDLQKKYYKEEYFMNLKNSYTKVNLKKKLNDTNSNIGGYSLIDKMIELSYEEDIKFKYDIAEQIGYINQIYSYWRKTLGDGNCYYRSVIFQWFENIIFENRLEEFIYIINRIETHFIENNQYIKDFPNLIKKSITTIDKSLVINILLYIIDLLRKNEIENAYEILLKSFNFSSSFDSGMIMYLRYEIFLFIFENQNKYYSEDFPVQLGNLLPSQYEREDGTFLFKDFYENEILKQYTYAEKISIYVTPYIIKRNIKLLMYDYGVNCNIQTKEFSCHLKSKHTINLLYRKCHYDILYSNEISSKWKVYLNRYLLDDKLKVVNEDLIKYYKENEVREINPMESKIFDKKLKINSLNNMNKKNLTNIQAIENEINLLKDKLKSEEKNIEDYKIYSGLLSNNNFSKGEIKSICCICKSKILEKISLPCVSCDICQNVNCIEEYFSLISNKINSLSNENFISCICSKNLNLKLLKEYCLAYHNRNLHNQLKKYYLNLFNLRCMFCKIHNSEEKDKTYIRIDNFNIRKFFEKEICHWKCRNCKSIPNEILECFLCEEIHY